MADDKQQDQDDPKKQAPDNGSSGKADDKSTQAPLNLPEKLKGKTAEQIAEMYVEAEKKIGEQSTTVAEARKIREDNEVMLRAIWSDPETLKKVEGAIKTYVSGKSGEPDPEERKKGADEKDKPSVPPEVAEVRMAQETQIMNEFYSKYGYDKLEGDEKASKFKELGSALAEIVDPGGKKPVRQILSEISLSRLPKFLEYAHFISRRKDYEDRIKSSLSEEENRGGEFGTFSSSSVRGGGQTVTLTKKERETAKNMGVSEEEYLKQKVKIQKDNERFE